jgi:16S rRNA C967 or C1407 C5-methylase (RsmB/RsmF family)
VVYRLDLVDRPFYRIPGNGAVSAPQRGDDLSTTLTARRVLAVDDNATNLKVLTNQLKRCGIAAECVASAQEALAAMKAAQESGRPFEVALVDPVG